MDDNKKRIIQIIEYYNNLLIVNTDNSHAFPQFEDEYIIKNDMIMEFIETLEEHLEEYY